MCVICVNINICSCLCEGVGYGQVFATIAVSTYYLSIMALTVRYFVDSFKSPLPWSICRDEWGPECSGLSMRSAIAQNMSTASMPNVFLSGNRSSAELYYM